MGPITGMTPDKKAETPSAEKVAGLSQIHKMGSLPEAVGASKPKSTLVDCSSPDDELTNLNWLHESTDLLHNFTIASEGVPVVNPLYDIEGDNMASFSPASFNTPERSPTSKPPYSFSLLIYMAIEHSPNKCLPVKEIYGWILERFPYFETAPTGWKNSVRHNLSLNKCFQKVERGHGKVNGKGSLWCVDPEYKPNLMQALKKQPFSSALAFYTPPTSPPRGSSPPCYLTSVIKQNHNRSLKESDIDAAAAMMLLNTSIEKGALQCEQQQSPTATLGKKRSYSNAFKSTTALSLNENDPAAVDPKEDHNYSASGEASQRCDSRSSVSSLSSFDEVYEFIPKTSHAGSDGSEGFHSEEETDIDSEEDPLGDSGYASQPYVDTADQDQPGKKNHKVSRPDIDEELKEAAGSLLHLAGIRTCLDSLLNAKTQSQKQRKTWQYQ
ncbi:forkhead box protein N2 [Ambystoma mexicanum]|uniref:forkhead box protein N2 n=1 Tax=Ambystoma mexicanum TaxID=8296 RepID=UPI0037E8CCE9